ncbi:hypothetical protein B0A49_07424 [Cryomyces minteri]|uniref:Uncharacterized protein n=1 Tax=Cryomyces minteri TaxID=331657 RepID=A0A4U0X2G3_9PEZI|nr:hypothetical protein B0A49_07424 [Cryomyces minteri]
MSLPSSPPPYITPLPSRKKRNHAYTFDDANTSSDPIYSDDAADAIEDYTGGSPRKYYRGSWWSHDVAAQAEDGRAAVADFARNGDSGVWMGSDSTDDSLGDGSGLPTRRALLPLRACPGAEKVATKPLTAEDYARHEIERCVELNEEIVDLSAISLDTLSDVTLRPLHQLIRPPRDDLLPPDSDEYGSFLPRIQLFLSRNALRTVPSEIFALENLAVLSLRNNKIAELPSSIGNLRNLVELNVASNRLRWLPWETLSLIGRAGKLKRLSVLPNPMVQGFKRCDAQAEARVWRLARDVPEAEAMLQSARATLADHETDEAREPSAWFIKLQEELLRRMRAHELGSDDFEDPMFVDVEPVEAERYPWKQEPIHVASTPIAFLTIDGQPQRESVDPPSSTHYTVTHVPATESGHAPTAPDPTRTSGVPSLLELASRECGKSPSLSRLSQSSPDELPAPVLRVLERAIHVRRTGGRSCSTCGRPYAIPRAEWIEYWHHVPDALVCSVEEMFLPFLRHACSWGCAVRR